MATIHSIHPWTVHLSSSDEWEALCGDPNSDMLTELSEAPLPGYRVCKSCLEIGKGKYIRGFTSKS